MHDYNIHGTQKRITYYYLSVISIFLSTAIPQALQTLSQKIGVPIIITVSSAAFFSVLYFLYDRFIWRLPILGIPNLSGDWECSGKSFKYCEENNRNWTGVIHIRQTWRQILITLDTEDSKSVSISLSGSMIKLSGLGIKLHYLYSNQPKPDHKELHPHLGHCEIIFSNDFTTGKGNYFTNQERLSYGSMNLKRISK